MYKIAEDIPLGTTVTTTITVSSPATIKVDYGDDEILSPTYATTSYSFDWESTGTGKMILSLSPNADDTMSNYYDRVVYTEKGEIEGYDCAILKISSWMPQLTMTAAVVNKTPYYHNLLNNGEGVLRFREGFNGWTSFNTFSPERMGQIDSILYSFKNGKPYVHNTGRAVFYGDQYDSVIAFRVADPKGVIKILEYITLESDIKPTYTHVVAENPYNQATDLCPADFVYKEGTFYSSFFRDKLSPNFTDPSESVNFAQALIDGDQMRAKWFDIFLVFNNESDFRLSAANIGTYLSSGHKKQ